MIIVEVVGLDYDNLTVVTDVILCKDKETANAVAQKAYEQIIEKNYEAEITIVDKEPISLSQVDSISINLGDVY